MSAPDLPAHGSDPAPASAATMDSYSQRIVDVLDAEPEPVVLVGHSSGGMIITQVAEMRPERIRRLVYVCAYLPSDGQSLLELGQSDPDQLIVPNLELAPDGTGMVRTSVVREALFADATDDDFRRYLARIDPEPMAVATTPVKVTAERFGRIPRTYLETTRDRGISPALQRRMRTAVPCEPVVSLDTGHMPMYSAPESLAAHLADAGYGEVNG